LWAKSLSSVVFKAFSIFTLSSHQSAFLLMPAVLVQSAKASRFFWTQIPPKHVKV